MSPARNEAQTVGAVLGFCGLASNELAHSHSPTATCQEPTLGAFLGPANERQARVLVELLRGQRLTNNDVRSIAGALNGPHIIQGLREQGLGPVTDLCTEWIKCRDRDGHAESI